MSWIDRLKSLAAIIAITALLFELLSFAVTKMGMFLINKTPGVYRSISNPNYDKDVVFGRTERDPWGAWHVANEKFRQTNSCFDVLMTFNEIGARDETFANLSENSLVLLGDSFAEGFGVSFEDTSQFLIEKDLGLAVANLGASGGFGPLQELLLYKEYQNLTHNGLIIYVLPANDFTDNDASVWVEINVQRYRPYFSNKGNPLVPFYFPESSKRDTFHFNFAKGIKLFIGEYLWSANALRTLLMILRENFNINSTTDFVKSFFYDANILQQSHLLLAYEEILNLAQERNVLFVIIPIMQDIKRNQLEASFDSYKQMAWYQGLEAFESRQQHKVSVLNLMDHLPSNTAELFFDCDQHWSPHGNSWAATKIVDHIRANNLFIHNK